jgi:hypothetical protein
LLFVVMCKQIEHHSANATGVGAISKVQPRCRLSFRVKQRRQG